MSKPQTLHIGTSGWHYSHWAKSFYPAELPHEERLPFYARRFSTVEINNSFYQLPKTETLKNWANKVPKDFVFAIKASRYITHMKKLKDPETSIRSFIQAAGHLENKLGPILFQLPPKWVMNLQRLESFIKQLPGQFRYAFEFRDPSWLHESVYETLSQNNMAFCIYDINGFLSPKKITADFIYVRLHGPDQAYQGKYDTQSLAGWAGAFTTWNKKGAEIFCYFDNDQAGYAARNADELSRMLHIPSKLRRS